MRFQAKSLLKIKIFNVFSQLLVDILQPQLTVSNVGKFLTTEHHPALMIDLNSGVHGCALFGIILFLKHIACHEAGNYMRLLRVMIIWLAEWPLRLLFSLYGFWPVLWTFILNLLPESRTCTFSCSVCYKPARVNQQALLCDVCSY